MSFRIGIAVAADRVRAVGVRRGRILWASEAEVTDDGGLRAAVGGLIADAPIGRRFRPPVHVALGPGYSQVKRVVGLPPLRSRRLLAQLVAAGASRFFITNGTPPITGIAPAGPNDVWAAALDLSAVREVETACRANRLRLVGAAPVAFALANALTGETFAWQDGAIRLEIRRPNDRLEMVRRYHAGTSLPPPPVPETVDALASLGDQAWRYADAFGVATLPVEECIRVSSAIGPVTRVWRRATASSAVLLAILFIWILPAAVAERAARGASARLAAVDADWRIALQAEDNLARFTAALSEVALFEADRRSVLMLLAEITQALPEHTAVVALRVDSAAGSMVTLAPRAGAVVGPLEQLTGITSLEIVGPVTRELMQGRELERVSLRFRISGGTDDPAALRVMAGGI